MLEIVTKKRNLNACSRIRSIRRQTIQILTSHAPVHYQLTKSNNIASFHSMLALSLKEQRYESHIFAEQTMQLDKPNME
jgi:ABC-type Na+ transport system ATPase subunit NatA